MRFLVGIVQVLVLAVSSTALKSVDISPDILESKHGELTTSSPLGSALLSSATRIDTEIGRDLEDGDDQSWLANYAIKFQGCHHVKQWNENVDGEEDVRLQSYRLVRFRLCPANSCSSRSGSGCGRGYGEYIVDLDTYVKAYTQAARHASEYECQLYMYKHCDCQENDDKGDDFDKEICEYQCFSKGRQSRCIDRNPYYDDDDDKDDYERMVEKYVEGGCREFEIPEYDDDDGNRRLDEDEEIQYYIGPYCADQGGKIYLGMFTDDTCTNFADSSGGRTTYKTLMRGISLPYSTHSVVGMDCVSCLEQRDPNKQQENNNNNNNGNDEVRISNGCAKTYKYAGKCETNLDMDRNGGPSYINEAACYFIDGVKIIRRDGILDTSATRPNKVVSSFIFIFSVSFVLLGAYIYYLRMKLGMKIDLN
mmetsp:Transcript_14647/g.20900  ORF Transcript_14647/g.20900 Transcript_14647/m.20900 type:complete len:422 (-) Transcript_14647:112-1377(-)|eukprot:CAMPEP_0184871014 /NCGR_PEP_ID=MMETSP0580-20130426/39543_1 /TAXON_ID=1118495 /ORGANISM="Dactyliosolen fragilissimus" /LENGTH=421 /DNA_ID=CAMNT_0027373437 /DNA_START=115 /DNA_END=1380 /DNA_ORIENTATION=-